MTIRFPISFVGHIQQYQHTFSRDKLKSYLNTTPRQYVYFLQIRPVTSIGVIPQSTWAYLAVLELFKNS